MNLALVFFCLLWFMVFLGLVVLVDCILWLRKGGRGGDKERDY